GANLNVLGGAIQALNVGFIAPNAKVDINADRIDGIVSVKACDLAAKTAAGDLLISNLDLTGDPIFNVPGDFVILVGPLVFPGEIFKVTAGGKIEIQPNLSTAHPPDCGGDVILEAGTNILLADVDTSGVIGGGTIAMLAGGSITTGQLNTSGGSRGGFVLALAFGGNATTGGITTSP